MNAVQLLSTRFSDVKIKGRPFTFTCAESADHDLVKKKKAGEKEELNTEKKRDGG